MGQDDKGPEDGAGPAEFSDAQRAGLDARQIDQDRTLAAMHQLEASLAAAAPGRELDWRAEVLGALAVLVEAAAAEADNADRPLTGWPNSRAHRRWALKCGSFLFRLATRVPDCSVNPCGDRSGRCQVGRPPAMDLATPPAAICAAGNFGTAPVAAPGGEPINLLACFYFISL